MIRAPYSIDIDDCSISDDEHEARVTADDDEPDTTYDDERELDDEYRRDCIRGILRGG